MPLTCLTRTVYNLRMAMNAPPTISSTKVTFILILTTFLWGGSFVFNKIAFREMPPVTFMFFRFSLATLIMGAFCHKKLMDLNRNIVCKGIKVGLALLAANLSFVVGVFGTTISRAGFLNNLFVLLIPFLSFLLWKERVSRLNLIGIGLAVGGLWQLACGGAAGFNRGDFFSTVCALFISIHIILVSRLLHDEDVYLVTFVQFATVAVVGGLLFSCLPNKSFSISTNSGGALLYCAIFPTVICFTLQNMYQRYSTPTRAGIIYTLDPVWSMLGGIFILGESLNSREWIGCSLIFGSLLLPFLLDLAVSRIYREGPTVSSA